MARVGLPTKRLKGLVKLLVELPATAERQMIIVELPDGTGPRALVMFDGGILLRASNALKAVRIHCTEWH